MHDLCIYWARHSTHWIIPFHLITDKLEVSYNFLAYLKKPLQFHWLNFRFGSWHRKKEALPRSQLFMGHAGASGKSPNDAPLEPLSLRLSRPVSAPLLIAGQGNCGAPVGHLRGTCTLLTAVMRTWRRKRLIELKPLWKCSQLLPLCDGYPSERWGFGVWRWGFGVWGWGFGVWGLVA